MISSDVKSIFVDLGDFAVNRLLPLTILVTAVVLFLRWWHRRRR